jgi:hypothetical protein
MTVTALRTRTPTRALRLAVKPVGAPPSAPLDGAWWPYSGDLQKELPPLLSALEAVWGRITRVAVDPLRWRPLPEQVQIARHLVEVAPFRAEQDPHKLVLLSYGVGRWDLLVIPPRTGEAAAARMSAAATDPNSGLTASALVGFKGADVEVTDFEGADPPGVLDAQAAWESEGGAAASPPMASALGRTHVSRR